MRKKIFVCIIISFSFKALTAQDDEKIFTKVPVEANTNPRLWADHVKKKTQLPDSVLSNIPPGIYRVHVQFVVDLHGNIGQVKAKNDPGYGFAQRGVNIISSYKGVWQPANQCGRNVKAYREEAITFVVADQ